MIKEIVIVVNGVDLNAHWKYEKGSMNMTNTKENMNDIIKFFQSEENPVEIQRVFIDDIMSVWEIPEKALEIRNNPKHDFWKVHYEINMIVVDALNLKGKFANCQKHYETMYNAKFLASTAHTTKVYDNVIASRAREENASLGLKNYAQYVHERYVSEQS